MSNEFTYSGKIVDVIGKRIFPGEITVSSGKIKSIKEIHEDNVPAQYILPGLVDAHVHIESSMLIPSEFARLAVTHGTVSTVSDPHEIGNVLGRKGVNFMIRNGEQVPFKFYFGAPSCVPATPFETSGAEINVNDIDELLKKDQVKYLAEMMNYPGVLNDDPQIRDKIQTAEKYGKPVDGHAPGLRGKDARAYAEAGISTDHECYTMEEAQDKLNAGMYIQIREGSAAKNFEALIPLLKDYPDKIMFCSDDKHPDELLTGHINQLVKRALDYGYDLITALLPCTVNPGKHYKLHNGLLQKDDPADFIIIDDPENFNILKTFIDGQKVAENGESCISKVDSEIPNKFVASDIMVEDIQVEASGGKLQVIDVKDGQLVTHKLLVDPLVKDRKIISDTENDILKIVVVNRYNKSKPSVGFIHNIGLKKGAIVSTVAHDSHNIIAVGVEDQMIIKAIEGISERKGGIGFISEDESAFLALPVAGIMTNQDAAAVSREYKRIDAMVKNSGSKLSAPFMSLSFMALLVIPSLKISDLGLFDGDTFSFTPLIPD
ncbi:MAG: adenine deaminase [Bacteroidales bacterium]|nr:adenine deaminase [Bacteroidales bacterium]